MFFCLEKHLQKVGILCFQKKYPQKPKGDTICTISFFFVQSPKECNKQTTNPPKTKNTTKKKDPFWLEELDPFCGPFIGKNTSCGLIGAGVPERPGKGGIGDEILTV